MEEKKGSKISGDERQDGSGLADDKIKKVRRMVGNIGIVIIPLIQIK